MNNKKILILSGAFTLCFSMTACVGYWKKQGQGDDPVPGDLLPVTYLFAEGGSVDYNDTIRSIIADFNKIAQNDGFYIKIEKAADGYYPGLATDLGMGKGADIFNMEHGSFNNFKNNMEPLDEYIANSSVFSTNDLWNLNDKFKDPETNQLKALIKDFSPDFMLIYNKSMLNQYNAENPGKQYNLDRNTPVTWKYFYEMTSAIQNYFQGEHKFNNQNVKFGTSLAFASTKHLHDMVQSTGANMYTDDFKAVNIGDSRVRESYAFYLGLQKDNVGLGGAETAIELAPYIAIQNGVGGLAPASHNTGTSTNEQTLFSQGKCFSIFNGLYSFTDFDFYSIDEFEFDIAPHPVFHEGDNPFGSTSAMVSHAINSASKHKDQAWKFLEYFQTEGLKKLAKIAYNIPGNKTIAGSNNFLEQSNPKAQDLVNFFYNFVNSGYCVPTVYNPRVDFSTVDSQMTTVFSDYLRSGSSKHFDEVLNDINQRIKDQVK